MVSEDKGLNLVIRVGVLWPVYGADTGSCMLTGPASLSTVTIDELRAQNSHSYLVMCVNEDFAATRESLRLPGLFLVF